MTDNRCTSAARIWLLTIALLLMLSAVPGHVAAINTWADYTAYPPLLSAKIPPNVIIALDVSGSMKLPAYKQSGVDWRTGVQTDFNPQQAYFGYFVNNSRYRYDTEKQFFFASDSGEWDGNFLNWATMRRIDIARKLIVGGKVSVNLRATDPGSGPDNRVTPVNRNKARQDQNWSQNWDGWYIIEGQNEPFDGQFYKQYRKNASGGHTPSAFADGTLFRISRQRLIPQRDPAVDAFPLSPQVEVGRLSLKLKKGEEWHWVPFVNHYNQPRVVITSQSAHGNDPLGAPRIRFKNGWNGRGNDGFFVRLQEWDYLDGEHTTEDLAYLVVESRSAAGHALGCLDIKDDQGAIWQFCAAADAQPVSSGQCGVLGSPGVTARQINWDAPLPAAKPIVLTSLCSWDPAGDTDALALRTFFPGGNLDRSLVRVTMQEQESKGGGSRCQHDSVEQVAAIAVVPPGGASGGGVGRWSYAGQKFRLQAGMLSAVTQDWSLLRYDQDAAFSERPILLSAIQSSNETDPATIRIKSSVADENERLVELMIDEERSADNETLHRAEAVGWLAIEVSSGYAIRVGVREEPIGLLQKASGSMRLGLAVYNYDHSLDPAEIYNGNRVNGGTLYPCYPDPGLPPEQRTTTDVCLPTGVRDPLGNSLRVVEEYPLLWGTTPIAETLVEIGNYLRQASPTGEGFYADKSPRPSYPSGVESDPYFYPQLGAKQDCAQTFVLHFNDGAPYRDWDGSHQPSLTGDGVGLSGENEMLDDVAYQLRHEDLRSDLELPGHQQLISYYVLAALGEGDAARYNSASRRLREAAINGAFVDQDADHVPDPLPAGDINQYLIDNIDPLTGEPDCRDKVNEWDRDGDCNPDGFYFADNGFALEKQLESVLLAISKRSSSGTAAAVVSNSRAGAGAIYQSIYYPEYDDRRGHTLRWAGQLQALLVDDYGNLREDTNGNQALDYADDLFVVFDTAAEHGQQVKKYRDGILQPDGSVLYSNGRLDPSEQVTPVATGDKESIRFLWTSSDWLNQQELSPTRQRSYRSADPERYIFTFVDDGDLLAEPGEVIDFTASNQALLTPYLHLSVPFRYTANKPPPGITTDDYPAFQAYQAGRLINWVRGQDQGPFSFGRSTLSAMRSRAYQYQTHGVRYDGTWRLGDIIHSTPTVVGRPAENLDLLYRDRSYAKFYLRYKNRRSLVYVGANDGMLHAFNAGFYDQSSRSWRRRPNLADGSVDNHKNNYELGAEVWAYIPHNLLPQLYWLTDRDYRHVYYNDLKPKVFDARVFPDDERHPNGWGTLLVAGMRLGGGAINADLDQDGRLGVDDKLMRSAFSIFDVTDPEAPPQLLAEVTAPGLGFTTSYPAVIRIEDGRSGRYGVSHYLVFGSGPASATGLPDAQALSQFASRQPGRLFVLSLDRLTDGRKQLCFVRDTGECATAGSTDFSFAQLESNSLVSEPISVDWDLDYSTDAVYFGTVDGNAESGWGGTFRRLLVNDDADISHWDANSLFLDLSPKTVKQRADGTGVSGGQPISAAPTAGLERRGGQIERWLFFGTGRFLTATDGRNGDQQSYYGLKEPKAADGNWSYATLQRDVDLLDVSKGTFFAAGTGAGTFAGLSSFQRLSHGIPRQQGWLLNFSDLKERNISQATLLGNILTFTSFTPRQNPCAGDGESWLYALDYRTGTAGSLPFPGSPGKDRTDADDNVAGRECNRKRSKIGAGVASTPGIHTGRERGSRVLLQTSGGAIINIEQDPTGPTRSGMLSWEVER